MWLVSAVSGPAFASQPTAQSAEGRALAAVTKAESAVQAAAAQKALWTTAQEALHEAQAAFDRKDFATAERLARFAAEQARLGIAQRSYPPFPFVEDRGQ